MVLAPEKGGGIELTGLVDDEERTVVVQPGQPLDSAFGQVAEGPDNPVFHVEVGGVYQVPWPSRELALISAPEPDEPPFYMFSDFAGGLVYVQGPMDNDELPEPDHMIGEGQTEVARDETAGHTWIELAYDHDDLAWRQRHIIVPFSTKHTMVVTTQAVADDADKIHTAAHALAQSIVPYME